MMKSTGLRVMPSLHSFLTDFLGLQASVSWQARKDGNIMPTLRMVSLTLRKFTHVPMLHDWKSRRSDVSLDHHYYTVQTLPPKTSEFVEQVWVVEE